MHRKLAQIGAQQQFSPLKVRLCRRRRHMQHLPDFRKIALRGIAQVYHRTKLGWQCLNCHVQTSLQVMVFRQFFWLQPPVGDTEQERHFAFFVGGFEFGEIHIATPIPLPDIVQAAIACHLEQPWFQWLARMQIRKREVKLEKYLL